MTLWMRDRIDIQGRHATAEPDDFAGVRFTTTARPAFHEGAPLLYPKNITLRP